MGADWTMHKLGDLVDIVHGYAFKGEYFSDTPPGDVLLTPGNFAIGGGFKADKLKFYRGPVPSEYVLRPGDLLITMTDLSKAGDTLGYPAIVPHAVTGPRYLHNQRLGKVVLRHGADTDMRFLYYVLCTQEYRHEVLSSATGSTVRHTSPGRIGRYQFMLPSPPEQRAIAHILGTLDDKIELNRRMNRTLEDIARALFKSWFVDFDPVHAKARGEAPPGLDPAIADLFPTRFVDSDLGPIPEGWRVDEVGNITNAVGGGTPSTKDDSYWTDGEYWFATPKDMSGLTSPVLLRTERKVTKAGLNRISSGLLPAGTVLLSSRAPIGYLAIAGEPVCVNQGIIAMIADGPVSNYYMINWCSSNLDTIKANAGGTTFAEISKRNFRPILAVVPSRTVMTEYDRIVGPLYEQIMVNEHQSRTLADLRDTLLPKLMSGELRVPDTADIANTQVAAEAHSIVPAR